MLFFWWMRWKDVGCGNLHVVRNIGFDLSYDTAALVQVSSSLSDPSLF